MEKKEENFGVDNTGKEWKKEKKYKKGDEGKKDNLCKKDEVNCKKDEVNCKKDEVNCKKDEVNCKKEDVTLVVNGKKLPVGNFPKKIIKEIVIAMINSLKGGEEAKEIEIKIKK